MKGKNNMLNRKRLLKYFIFFVTVILLIATAVLIYVIKVTFPKNKGLCSVEKYSEYLEIPKTSPVQPSGRINNYYEAYIAAEKVLKKAYPCANLTRLSTYFDREVSYDPDFDVWFVYVFPRGDNILDGDMMCFLSSDGTVITYVAFG